MGRYGVLIGRKPSHDGFTDKEFQVIHFNINLLTLIYIQHSQTIKGETTAA